LLNVWLQMTYTSLLLNRELAGKGTEETINISIGALDENIYQTTGMWMVHGCSTMDEKDPSRERNMQNGTTKKKLHSYRNHLRYNIRLSVCLSIQSHQNQYPVLHVHPKNKSINECPQRFQNPDNRAKVRTVSRAMPQDSPALNMLPKLKYDISMSLSSKQLKYTTKKDKNRRTEGRKMVMWKYGNRKDVVS